MENDLRIPSRNVQRLGGLFLIVVSAAFIFWTWRTALSENYFYPKAAFIFPMFLFVGLGMTVFPNYKTERLARGEDISQLSGMKLITARWWAILAIGLFAGIANWLLLKFF